MKKTNIRLIGCGMFAEKFYIPTLINKQNINIELVDLNTERLEYFKNKFSNISISNDFKKLDKKPDGVIITLPHHLHYKCAKFFLENKIPIIVEKPITLNVIELDDLVKLSKENSTEIIVNNTRRLFPSFNKIKSFIKNKEIGEVTSVDITEGSEFSWPTVSGFYFNSKTMNSGVLADRGAHVIDLVNYWFGDNIKLLNAQMDSFGGGPESVFDLSLSVGKIKINLHFDWLTQQTNEININGTEGRIDAIMGEFNRFKIIKKNTTKIVNCKTKINNYMQFSELIIDNLLEIINQNKKAIISPTDVRESIRLIEQSYKNATIHHLEWYDYWSKINE